MAIDNKTLINVVNKRSNSYSVSFRNGDYYEWLPATKEFEDSQELTFREVQSLHVSSATFKKGYLHIDNAEARKRLGLETEKVKELTLSKDEIEKLLKGNNSQFNKLKSYEDDTEMMRLIVDIAKEAKVNNVSKLNKLSEWSGIPVELITPDSDDEE